MPAIELKPREQNLLNGEEGPAMQFAMQMILRSAELSNAPKLVDVSFAHIDACFYSGQAHVDFVRFLLDNNAKLSIPAWTNNGLVSLAQPELRSEASDAKTFSEARELMQLYQQLGCKPVWTCAPYQLPGRPTLGDHIVGSESNAVTFYNSVIGARTNKYGDFLEVCAALVGRVPYIDKHTDEGRRGQLLFPLNAIPDELLREDMFFHVLGHYVGKVAGSRVPVIDGLPDDTSEDQLKAVSAAVAASGGVALFHAVGVTPEAPDLLTAFQGREPEKRVDVSPADLIASRDSLSSGSAGPVNMVALGTPHFSWAEMQALAPLLEGRKVHKDVVFYVSTSRHVAELADKKGWLGILADAGVDVILDTCTYQSPAVRGCEGRVMTNSAKWAYYAPGMLKVDVVFGSMRECVESAVAGEVRRDKLLWQDRAWGL